MTSIRALVGQVEPPPNPGQHRFESGSGGAPGGRSPIVKNEDAMTQRSTGAIPKARVASHAIEAPAGGFGRDGPDGQDYEDIPLPPPPGPNPIDSASGVAFKNGEVSFIDPGKLVSLYEPKIPMVKLPRKLDDEQRARFHSESRRLFDEAFVRARQAGIGARAIIDTCPKYVRMAELNGEDAVSQGCDFWVYL